MFIESLEISSGNTLIREIKFQKGLNLIVDESKEQITGNNVGKTTVLKLIDFCLGGDPKEIYVDTESRKSEYRIVKDFLVSRKILIRLKLTSSFDEKSKKFIIERNFLSRKEIIRRINNEEYTEDEFTNRLSQIFFPSHISKKPSFRQIISHNIRIKDDSINNTLRTLNRYTTDEEYETLHLFLLGCSFAKAEERQQYLILLNQENLFKKRLEREQTKNGYEATLSIIENEIELLNSRINKLNINENFQTDLKTLSQVKQNINRFGALIGKLNIRREIIKQTEIEFNLNKSNIDFIQLKSIYSQANKHISNIQKTFEDLVDFHNKMIDEKVKYITRELPDIENLLKKHETELNKLLDQEKTLATKISKNDSFEELEMIITDISEKNRRKGEYENWGLTSR